MKRFALVDQWGDRITDANGDKLPDFHANDLESVKPVELKPFRVVMEKRSTLETTVYAIDESEAEDIALDNAWADVDGNDDDVDVIDPISVEFDDSEEPIDEDDTDEDED